MTTGEKGQSFDLARNLCSWEHSATAAMGLMTRRMIRTPSMTILRVDFKKGATLDRHQHIHEQVTMLESGLLKLEVDGQEIVLKPGDVIRIPSNIPHFTEALEAASTIEMFLPAREDIPSTDNAFLGRM